MSLNSKNEADLLIHIEFRINFVHRMHTDFIYYIPIIECSSDSYKIPNYWIQNDENIIKKIELFTSFVNSYQSFGILKVSNDFSILKQSLKNLLVSTEIKSYFDIENYVWTLIKQDNELLKEEFTINNSFPLKYNTNILIGSN